MTLQDVANKLAAKRIGAIVIVGAGGEVRGIVSERDIIRALSTGGATCLKEPVAQTMTRQVVTCQETDTLDELMAMMTARRFRHLPVVTDGALVGIVSIGDVVKHHVAEVEMEATAMRDYITHS
jgi:CBS domain-containing protein